MRISTAISLGYKKKGDSSLKKQHIFELNRLRAGPFGEKPRIGKYKISKLLEKKYA